MKELTIEEKVKKYDEAIERARNLYNSEETSAEVEIACENIFPELIESEDERIKRLLHSIASKMSFHLHDIFTNEEFQWFDAWANAWLEKQGETFTKKDVDDAYIKGVCDAKQELEKQGEQETLCDKCRKEHSSHSCQDITELGRCAVEKRYESIKIKKGKNYLCTKTHKYAGLDWIEGVKYYSTEDYSLVNQGCTYHCPEYSKEEHNDFFKEVEYYGCLESNKVEPKFEVGDWVVFTAGDLSTTLQIVNVDTDKKLYRFNDNSYLPIVDEECLHIWTIEEAKDGDVLISQYNNPFIYNGERDYCTIGAYCGLTVGDFFDIASKTNPWTDIVGIHPSTKEQRDHLFQKMKKAGFEWDAENKKLNKIEPKFHEGEWVVDKYGHVTKIMRVNNNFNHITYDCRPIEENSRDWPSYSENDIRLWDISDAKDGDVLVASDNSIFIFSHCIDNACVHHIALEVEDGTMDINYKLERGWKTIRGVCPATKEQRCLLFQKLKDADYEWDSIKKKLKRID